MTSSTSSSNGQAIAIVGMACRFPGANDLDAFWQNMLDGRDATGEIPDGRWDLEYWRNWRSGFVTRGAFIDGVRGFDPQFFRISPREAAAIDPRQRLIMEVAWEALEHASLRPDDLNDEPVGVFMGMTHAEYNHRFVVNGQAPVEPMYSGVGNDTSFASGRLSHFLGFDGPSLTVNTACSSALMALHLAVHAINRGECSAAVVGAVNLILSGGNSARLFEMGVLAPDGRCKAFDDSADGFGRGEGAGVVVIMPLERAQKMDCEILAVLRGSAINQDGGSVGMLAPNPDAQVRLVQSACADADITPSDIDYLECHGTGTPTGDPIELEALGRIFAERPESQPLQIGSVKTHVAHLEAAAGIVGLIKTVLVLVNEKIPPHLHLSKQPEVTAPIVVPTKVVPWKRGARKRYAGVSAFGLSGTNSHVILEEGPVRERRPTDTTRPLHVLPLSGTDTAPIRRQAARFAELMFDDLPLEDVCYSAGVARVHHPYRIAVISRSRGEAGKRLLGFAKGEDEEGVIVGTGVVRKPKTAFLFTGQGSQYLGMGRALYAQSPVFKAAMDACEALATPLMGQSLLKLIYENTDATALEQTAVQQPALFSIGYSLAVLWKSWGVQPDAVLGHSIGEIGAAVTAGLMSLEDGMKLAVTRGKLMQSLPQDGAMRVIFAETDVVQKHLEAYAGRVSIAAVNGPGLATISGETEAVEEIAAAFEAQEVQTRALDVSHAFHSPLMEPILDELTGVADSSASRDGQIPFISTVTAQEAHRLDGTYWRSHASGTVQFHQGMQALVDRGIRCFIEIGPKAVLVKMAQRAHRDAEAVWLPTIAPDEDWETAIGALAQAYVRGVEVDWEGFDAPYHRQRVAIPTYSFERRDLWHEEVNVAPATGVGAASSAHAAAPKANGAAIGLKEQVNAPTDWFYGVDWRVIPQLQAASAGGSWLILTDRGGVGGALAGALPGSVVVERASTSGPLGPNRYGVNPLEPDGMSEMLKHFGAQLANCRGAVYLWGLDQTPVLSGDEAAVAALPEGSVGALELTKALLDAQLYSNANFRLYLVTRNSQEQGNTPVDATQAPIWGLGRCIGLEHPELGMCSVDLDDSNDVGPLLALLQSTTNENQICLRGNLGYGSRLVARAPAPAALNIDSEASYLITGGLGALGLLFAQRLALRGAKHLVLFGRSAPKPAAEAVLTALRDSGVAVDVAAVDVTNEGQLAELVANVSAKRPIKGVIHTAGILDDGVLVHQTAARFESVMSPKVRGTINLYRACGKQPLDFMVFCSSVSSMFGAPGQSNYSAANAFMDAFAVQIRAMGVPAVSINWGPWAEAGMAQAHLKRIAARGLPPLASENALNAFEQACVAGVAQVGVVHLDLVRLAALGPRFRDRPFLVEVLATGDRDAKPDALSILEQLLQTPEDQREAVLEAWLAGQVALLLGMEAVGFDVQKPLTWHGLDSLMAVDLKKVLDDHVQVNVPHQLIQSGPSVRELCGKIVPMVDFSNVAAPVASQTAAAPDAGGPTFGSAPVLQLAASNTAIAQPAIGKAPTGNSGVAPVVSTSDGSDEEGVPGAIVAGLVAILVILTAGGLWFMFG